MAIGTPHVRHTAALRLCNRIRLLAMLIAVVKKLNRKRASRKLGIRLAPLSERVSCPLPREELYGLRHSAAESFKA